MTLIIILAVIVAYSELITLNCSSDSPALKYAEEIRHASNRAAGLSKACPSDQYSVFFF
jgi:hypothetical protein